MVVELAYVLHVSYTYAPDPCGGTEKFVESLTTALLSRGLRAAVAAPAKKNQTYKTAGVPVFRFRHASGNLPLNYLYGFGDPIAAASFDAIIAREHPDLVHLHAFSPAVSIRLVRSLKKCGIPIVFTYHTPTVSCQRGTLMEWGRDICDGRIGVQRCAACSLHANGLPRFVALLAARLPPAIGAVADLSGHEGSIGTVFRIPALIQSRHAAFRELLTLVDHIVAPSQWARDVLIRNGADLGKLTVSQQGVALSLPALDRLNKQAVETRRARRIKFVCLARLDPSKGLHVLVEALNLVPALDLAVDVFGTVQDHHNESYLRRLQRIARGDRRIRFYTEFTQEEIFRQLSHYDAMLVPSVWLETGPLVVLEAFAAGIPVIGSRLGGIAERILDGKDGMLVQPANVEAWADAIRRIVERPDLLAQLQAGVRPPRTIDDAAIDMMQIYSSLIPRM
jgi:glycosyltransferase involved in cell wall biosynthesis